MKIIVVEDEQRSREGLCRLIRSAPGEHEIIAQVSNGAAAVDIIKQLKPDLVFTDIKMPLMDGMALIESVRAHNMKTEFVVVSGYADFEFARKSITLGVADYLLKPVTLEDLELVLEHVERKLSGVNLSSGSRGKLRAQYPFAHPAVAKALDIIETGFAGKINQKDLADEMKLSAEYFSYLFSKNVGSTFSEFLRDYRIEKAKELYASGACPKQDVPYSVGYSDAKYFAQVFRSVTGESPAEYIKNRKL